MFRRKKREEVEGDEELQDELEEQIEDDFEIVEDVLDTDIEDREEDKAYILYTITDKNIPGLLEYTRGCGLKVTEIFKTLEDARNTMLMQYKAKRIIVIETGMGVFTATKARQELIDTISLADEDSEVIVFNSSSVLKIDSSKSIGKDNDHIKWVDYKSIVDTIAQTLTLGEKYEYDTETDEVVGVSDDYILKYKGKLDETVEDTKINVRDISVDVVISEILDGGESLTQYEPHV